MLLSMYLYANIFLYIYILDGLTGGLQDKVKNTVKTLNPENCTSVSCCCLCIYTQIYFYIYIFLMASLVGCRTRSRTLLRPLTPRRVRLSFLCPCVYIVGLFPDGLTGGLQVKGKRTVNTLNLAKGTCVSCCCLCIYTDIYM